MSYRGLRLQHSRFVGGMGGPEREACTGGRTNLPSLAARGGGVHGGEGFVHHRLPCGLRRQMLRLDPQHPDYKVLDARIQEVRLADTPAHHGTPCAGSRIPLRSASAQLRCRPSVPTAQGHAVHAVPHPTVQFKGVEVDPEPLPPIDWNAPPFQCALLLLRVVTPPGRTSGVIVGCVRVLTPCQACPLPQGGRAARAAGAGAAGSAVQPAASHAQAGGAQAQAGAQGHAGAA